MGGAAAVAWGIRRGMAAPTSSAAPESIATRAAPSVIAPCSAGASNSEDESLPSATSFRCGGGGGGCTGLSFPTNLTCTGSCSCVFADAVGFRSTFIATPCLRPRGDTGPSSTCTAGAGERCLEFALSADSLRRVVGAIGWGNDCGCISSPLACILIAVPFGARTTGSVGDTEIRRLVDL